MPYISAQFACASRFISVLTRSFVCRCPLIPRRTRGALIASANLIAPHHLEIGRAFRRALRNLVYPLGVLRSLQRNRCCQLPAGQFVLFNIVEKEVFLSLVKYKLKKTERVVLVWMFSAFFGYC